MSKPATRMPARVRHTLREIHRVCARGQHYFWGVRSEEHDLDRRISEKLWETWGDDEKRERLPAFEAEPRWRVGDRVNQRKFVARMLARQTK